MDIEEESAFYRALREFPQPSIVHCHSSRCLTYTDGVRFLADTLKAEWLVDLIARLQPVALRFAGLAELQVWELFVRDDDSAALLCSWQPGRPVFKQRIPATGFPLSYIRLYVRCGVLMLPSEL